MRSREGSGAFARPLAPGTYVLQAAAWGYASATQQIVVPEDGTGVEVLIELRRRGATGGGGRAGDGLALASAGALGSWVAGSATPGSALRLEPLRRNAPLVFAGIALLLVAWFGGWRLASTRRGRSLQPRTVISIPLSRVDPGP